jgi:hypothetical protein
MNNIDLRASNLSGVDLQDITTGTIIFLALGAPLGV